MKKVGIMTLYKNNLNYGGMLQAYALQKAVQNLVGAEGECVQISYKLSKTPFKDKLIHGLQYRSLRENIILCINLLKKGPSEKESASSGTERKAAFAAFEASIPHTQHIYTYQTIGECGHSFTHLITGSDQVWNGGVDLDSFCLGFAPSYTKKISYAASSASTRFGKWQDEIFDRNLPSFKAVSVREKSVVPYFEARSGKNVKTVLDPVFLLTKQEWGNIAIKPQVSSPYVFCYLLGKNEAQLKMAKKFARENQCKLITFPFLCDYSENNCCTDNMQIYDAGPREFLGIIQNAQCVITDSFHATAFSIIFSKPFLALPRFKNEKGTNNNHRVIDILSEFGLTEWYDREEHGIPKIDYCRANEIMQLRKKESFDFLRFALGDAT